MPRMLDLIRNSQVPLHLMQSAARGSLSVPPDETIEILVYLADHNVFGEQARLTLAGWDENASVAAAANPATSPEVLAYFVALENLRPRLLAALAENPSVSEEALSQVAARGSRSSVEALLASARVMNSQALLTALQSNPILRPNEAADVVSKLAGMQLINDSGAENISTEAEEHSAEENAQNSAAEEVLAGFLQENAAEVESEKDKPFQPIGSIRDEVSVGTTVHLSAVPTATSGNLVPGSSSAGVKNKHATAPATTAAQARKHAPPAHIEKRDSTLQKIAKLDVKGRIALAVRGSKEDRSILVRDGTKLVALAVLESPKVSDGEVEGFALQKNVLEAVLRQIPLKRRFAKNYNIMRNLVYNPRTPLDLSLGLMKGLLVHDLKNLSGNKEVSETIRKLALRMYKQKMEKKQ
ncbi:MAG: hypothetical protein WBS24_08115 [Terriglobales bacterium]